MFHVGTPEIVVAVLVAIVGMYRSIVASRSRGGVRGAGTPAAVPPRSTRVQATAPRIPPPQTTTSPAPRPRSGPPVRLPSPVVRDTTGAGVDVRSAVRSRQRLRDAIVLAEILSPPLALRE